MAGASTTVRSGKRERGTVADAQGHDAGTAVDGIELPGSLPGGKVEEESK
jgi:hypothetical protein